MFVTRSYFKKTALILAILFGLGFIMKGAFLLDEPVRLAVIKAHGPGWDHSLAKKSVAAVSRYGDWPELMLLGLIGFFVAHAHHSERWKRLFLIAMLASTTAGALTNTLRLTTGRTRPRVGPPIEQGWYGPYYQGRCFIGRSEFNSFPSGHTATAVGFAAVLLLGSPWWGAGAMILAFSVAASRLLLGAHHPSDLLAATFIALAVAYFFWKYCECYQPRWLKRLTE